MTFSSKALTGTIIGLALLFLGTGYNQAFPDTEENTGPAPGVDTSSSIPPPAAPVSDWREVLSGRQPIRIGLITGAKTIALTCDSPFQITSKDGSRQEGQPGQTVTFSGIMKYPIDLAAEAPGLWQIVIDDKPLADNYENTLRVFSSGSGNNARLTLVNLLPLEDYVAGVTAKEMGSGFSLEALRAQAIAIRSYALYYLGRHAAQGFDLCAATHCQVYKGDSDPLGRAAYAAYSTEGEVLLFQGRPIRAHYHSTSGGETASAEFLKINPADFPYLTAISDCNPARPILADEKQISDFLHQKPDSFGAISPRYRWSVTYSPDEVNDFVAQNLGKLIGQPNLKPRKVKSLQVSRRSGGRAQTLQIDTDSGTYAVEGDAIRWLFGRKPLQSTFFVIEPEQDHKGRIKKYTFIGAGWGHGVGMCQWGAEGRARAGQSATEILQAYYPGTEVWTTDVIDKAR